MAMLAVVISDNSKREWDGLDFDLDIYHDIPLLASKLASYLEIITRNFPKSRNFQKDKQISIFFRKFPKPLWTIIENMSSPDHVLY